MGCRFVISPGAANQISSAFRYYTTQSTKIGQEFLFEIEMQINRIANNPQFYRIYYKNYRRKLLDRFPYSLFYIYNKKKLLVEISILYHQKQNPESLEHKLNQ